MQFITSKMLRKNIILNPYPRRSLKIKYIDIIKLEPSRLRLDAVAFTM